MTYQYYFYAYSEPGSKQWHDQGSGPFPSIEAPNSKIDGSFFPSGYTTYISELDRHMNIHWREKPVNEVKFPTDGYTQPPTEEDADKNGYVQVLAEFGWELVYWSDWDLAPGVRPWRHTMFWKPKTDRDILEDALTSLSILKRSAAAPVPIHSKHLNNIDQALKILREKL